MANSPEYGEITQDCLYDAMNIVAQANTMFEELPATVRDKFKNDPGLFLDFVQDPKNGPEMVELGLTDPPYHDRRAIEKLQENPVTDNEASAE